MAQETILQNWVLTQFVLPFLLVFFIIFAILQKTKVLGAKKQIDALTAFVIGLIFVGVAYPKLVVTNLILFLSVAMVVVFVVLLLWGFASGGEKSDFLSGDKVKWAVGGVVLVAVIIATLWATGIDKGDPWNFLFYSSWSSPFWTNFIFIALIIVALAVAMRGEGK